MIHQLLDEYVFDNMEEILKKNLEIFPNYLESIDRSLDTFLLLTGFTSNSNGMYEMFTDPKIFFIPMPIEQIHLKKLHREYLQNIKIMINQKWVILTKDQFDFYKTLSSELNIKTLHEFYLELASLKDHNLLETDQAKEIYEEKDLYWNESRESEIKSIKDEMQINSFHFFKQALSLKEYDPHYVSLNDLKVFLILYKLDPLVQSKIDEFEFSNLEEMRDVIKEKNLEVIFQNISGSKS